MKKLFFYCLYILTAFETLLASEAPNRLIESIKNLDGLDKENIHYEIKSYKLIIDIKNYSKTEMLNGNSGKALKVLTIGSRAFAWRNDLMRLRSKALEEYVRVTQVMVKKGAFGCENVKSRITYITQMAPDYVYKIDADRCRSNKVPVQEKAHIKVGSSLKKKELMKESRRYTSFDYLSSIEPPVFDPQIKRSTKLELEMQLERALSINNGDGLQEFLLSLMFEIMETVYGDRYLDCTNFSISSETASDKSIEIKSPCLFKGNKGTSQKKLNRIIKKYQRDLERQFKIENGDGILAVPFDILNYTFTIPTSKKLIARANNFMWLFKQNTLPRFVIFKMDIGMPNGIAKRIHFLARMKDHLGAILNNRTNSKGSATWELGQNLFSVMDKTDNRFNITNKRIIFPYSDGDFLTKHGKTGNAKMVKKCVNSGVGCWERPFIKMMKNDKDLKNYMELLEFFKNQSVDYYKYTGFPYTTTVDFKTSSIEEVSKIKKVRLHIDYDSTFRMYKQFSRVCFHKHSSPEVCKSFTPWKDGGVGDSIWLADTSVPLDYNIRNSPFGRQTTRKVWSLLYSHGIKESLKEYDLDSYCGTITRHREHIEDCKSRTVKEVESIQFDWKSVLSSKSSRETLFKRYDDSSMTRGNSFLGSIKKILLKRNDWWITRLFKRWGAFD